MKKNKTNYNLIVSIIVLILIILFAIYIALYKRNIENFKLLILDVGLLVVISALSIANQLSKKKELGFVNSIMVVVFAICTFFIIKTPGTQAYPTDEKIPNFIGKNVSEAISWASQNNIKLIQNYEYSDSVLEYIVFAQDVLANTDVNDINELTLTVSSGFNYDKLVILPSYIGQDIESFLEEMKKLHLNNVIIDYQVNDYNNRNIILSQSVNGEIRRNDEVKLVVSLGKKSELPETNMISLIGKNIFDATLYMEQNGISYEVKYDFDNALKDTVIAQSIEADEIIKPFETKVVITVSKGNKILVPDLTKMTIDEVIKWISDNNLKISLSDAYDNKIEAGKVISSNYKENDEVAEGTIIKIVTSKGALKMPSFKTLNEFRSWASTYNIKYDEEYEFSTTIAKGNIIKFSLSPNDIIDESIPIVVTISNGKAITLPNYVGKSKSEIKSSCDNLGLSCTFVYGSYSSITKDVATSQNKKAGSSVISGTSLTITLSKGTAKTFTVDIYESQLTFGNADATITTLKNYFAANYPGVTFNFLKKKTNQYPNSGYIHEDSPVKDGTKVTQGNSYSVWITTK